MSKLKLRPLLIAKLLISPLLLFAVLEVGLSLFWENPYSATGETFPMHTRFHPKGITEILQMNGRIYKGSHVIEFNVTEEMFISSGEQSDDPKRLALGGSTTECGLVPEGQRWTDLLTEETLNYGVAGNTSIDSYYNLKFILESGLQTPTSVLVMHAVNDLHEFFSAKPSSFKIQGWNKPPTNQLADLDSATNEVFAGIQILDSATLSFVNYQLKRFKGRGSSYFYQIYLDQRIEQEALEPLSPVSFKKVLRQFRERFLPAREAVYQSWNELATRHHVKLVMLTQPHAYRDDFVARNEDLRLFPVIDGKKLTLDQTALMMDELNQQTRAIAERAGHELVGLAGHFDDLPSTGMFYDSVHYTMRGSQQFAQILNSELVADEPR